MSGGIDSGGRALKDMWLFDVKSNKWKEVRLIKSSCNKLTNMYYIDTIDVIVICTVVCYDISML